MLSVGGLTLYPIHYRAAFASSLIPSPLSHWLPLQEAYPRGETVISFTFSIDPRVRSCLSAGGATSTTRSLEPPYPTTYLLVQA